MSAPRPEEGCTRCACGAKYWDRFETEGEVFWICHSCGDRWRGGDATEELSLADFVAPREPSVEDLARCVLVMAANGGMPDTFWLTDRRILLACQVLGVTPHEARAWAHEVRPEWAPEDGA